jgi:hypothetical protein
VGRLRESPAVPDDAAAAVTEHQAEWVMAIAVFVLLVLVLFVVLG